MAQTKVTPYEINLPYKFSVYRNAALTSASGGALVVVFDSKDYDTGSNYSTSTGYFTAPVNGYYDFAAAIAVTTNGTRIFVSLYKNGVEFKRGNDNPSGAYGASVAAQCYLAAGDTLGIMVYTSSAEPLNVGGAVTWFQGRLISTT